MSVVSLVFLPRDAMLARYMLLTQGWRYRAARDGSVSVSVRLSQVGVLLKRLNVGWVKIGDFRQITGYISKTVEDRHIVCIKVE